MAAGAALRFRGLGVESLWCDEVWSLQFATQWNPGLSALFARSTYTTLVQDVHPPLYYLLQHFWLVFGTSEAGIRSLSAVVGILSLPVAYRLGRRLHSGRVGLLAAGLLAVSPIHIYYSQEARMYALAIFLCLVSYERLVAWLQDGNQWAAVGYYLAATGALYTHYYCVFALLAQGVYLLAVRKDRRVWTAFALLGLAGFSFLPWLPFMQRQWHEWLPNLWGWVGAEVPKPRFANVLELLPFLGWGESLTPRPLRELSPTHVGLLVVFVTGLVVGALFARKTKPAWLAVLWVVVPIGAVFLVSQFRPMFYPRFFVIVLPACLLLAAAGFVRLASRHAVFWVLPAAFALGLVWLDFHPAESLHKPDWRGAMDRVSRHALAGDVVWVHPDYEGSTAAYYVKPVIRIRDHVWPVKPGMLGSQESTRAFLDRARGEHAGAWLVIGPYAPDSERIAADLMAAGARGVWSFPRGGYAMRVVLLSGDRSKEQPFYPGIEDAPMLFPSRLAR